MFGDAQELATGRAKLHTMCGRLTVCAGRGNTLGDLKKARASSDNDQGALDSSHGSRRLLCADARRVGQAAPEEIQRNDLIDAHDKYDTSMEGHIAPT